MKTDTTKTILWDDENLKSIKKAERLKTLYENRGYAMTETKQTGLTKWKMVFKKLDKNNKFIIEEGKSPFMKMMTFSF